MSIKRMMASAALGVCLTFAVVAGPATATCRHPAAALHPTLPQVSSAQQGATWLAGQLTPSGLHPVVDQPGPARPRGHGQRRCWPWPAPGWTRPRPSRAASPSSSPTSTPT